MEFKTEISRRKFLLKSSDVVKSTAALQAISALSLSLSTLACSSSSASSQDNTSIDQPNLLNPSPIPSDWPANVGKGKTVIILGGGVSGLVCAYEMERLGYECTVIEASERLGGRVRTIRGGDEVTELDSSQTCQFESNPALYFNAGAARIPHHHQLILGYCRMFSIALEPFINENTGARFHSTNAFTGQSIIARQLNSDRQGYIGELLALAINQGNLDSQFSGNEKNNLLAMLQQFSSLDDNFSYQGSTRAGFPGQNNANSRQRGALLETLSREEILASEFWQFKMDFFKQINQQSTMIQPVGGMDKIVAGFEQNIDSSIILDAQVTEIRKTSPGVRIVYKNSTSEVIELQADYCVCTIPATVLRNIVSDISESYRSEIASFNYSQSGKLAFQSERFWETQNNIYGGISWTDQNITQLWYPNHQLGEEQGVIVGAYTFGSTQGNWFANLSPSNRISQAIEQGNQLHSDYSSNVNRGISISWPKIPFQLGAWGISQPNVLLTEDENIFFAGEHLSILQGWQEGAILSAYHAIDLVVNKT